MSLIVLEMIFTSYLVGLIWTIQRVHYPSFSFIEETSYKTFQNFHMKQITFVVGPIMLAEMVISVKNLINSNFGLIEAINFSLLSIIWISTILWTVPLHNQLLERKDKRIIKKLVKSNLLRSIIWSLRLSILIYLTLTK